ncbi:competence protein ComEC [Pseudobutyrivibrio sp. YE44]|uniref:ComEC/Rec2 family competence protein n=1 Tax=Pseudobutyrivibrio sp. YE44 TaxID=1520802 RepID=UPI0008865F01|nr:ComEC/Rec2 family competence protein [Pseudobutyrivibrio sp. YE44]SDB12111.1 competence protein ComEC [Pseudobutyrivibrio sp. YE44]
MLKGRFLYRISLLILLLILISTYAPWDFLGVYDKALAAESSLSTGEHIKAEGYVYHKELKNDKIVYYVKDASVKNRRGILKNTSFIFKSKSKLIPNNCKVNIEGDVKLFSNGRNDGSFDMKNYYNSLGLYFEVVNSKSQVVNVTPVARMDYSYRIRHAFSVVFEEYLPGEEAGFLSSVVIGEKGDLDNNLKTLFQNVGIAHILAVSGLHVSVVCMALYNFLRRRGLGFFVSSMFAGIIAVGYGIITGGSVSAIRAIGMFLIYLGAQIVGESYDLLTALSVMATILLMENPLYVKNGSFIMSFGAIIGIVYIVLPLNEQYKNYSKLFFRKDKLKELPSEGRKALWFIKVIKRLPGKVLQYSCSGLIFSFGMTAAMLPIVTQLYYQTPLYSVVVNVVVLPFMPVLLGIGLLGGFLGIIYLPLAKPILMIGHFIIYCYELLSDYVQRLPGSTIIVGHHSFVAVILYYFGLVVVIYGGRYLVRGSKSLSICRRRLTISILLMVAVIAMWLFPRKGNFEIDILDVGQGDGIYINSGDGVHFFIDGGSTSSESVGQYSILPFLKYKGVGCIDYWFVSHTDEDHISGLIELLEAGYEIKNIVFTEYIPKGEKELFAGDISSGNSVFWKIVSLANNNKTKILYMNPGDIIGSKHLSFTCLYPGRDAVGVFGDDVNALSLALLMSYDENIDGEVDYTAFLGGDLAAEQERIVADRLLKEFESTRSTNLSYDLTGYANDGCNSQYHVNLLKVSHHGSRYSSDSDFLEVLSPDVAVISCAERNRYGHPADEAVERIEVSGAQVYYTMKSGRIRVDKNGVNRFVK